MFEIKTIQAGHGDALFISYGDSEAPRHILIDGGTADCKGNLLAVLDGARTGRNLRLEVLVVTHYDLDHIEGIIELLKDKPAWLDIGDIWFNGKKHIRSKDVLGSIEGDELTQLIEGKYPWNCAFDAKRICTGKNAPIILSGGMQVWVLSPDEQRLAMLSVHWKEISPSSEKDYVEAANDLLGRVDKWPLKPFAEFKDSEFKPDQSVPNGSSIALMLEFDGRRALFTGDAFASVVTTALKNLWPLPVDVAVLKVSHHGSKANTNAALLKAINCNRFLLSADGKIHKHPDQVLISRIISNCENAELIFNYKQDQTIGWEFPHAGWPNFTSTYPVNNEIYVSVNV